MNILHLGFVMITVSYCPVRSCYLQTAVPVQVKLLDLIIDYCFSSAVVKSIEIFYEYSISGHAPFLMMLDIKSLPGCLWGANSAPQFNLNGPDSLKSTY